MPDAVGVALRARDQATDVMRAAVDALRMFRAIARHPDADPEALRCFRARRLRRVITYAYARVPYYRRLFDAHGVSPDTLRGPEDLQRIPITSRETLQRLTAAEVVARGVDPRRLNAWSTSGSSGRPITVRRSWAEDRILGSIRLRAMRAYGVQSGDRIVSLGGAPGTRHAGASRMQRLLARRDRQTAMVDCTAPVEDILRELARLQPTVLTGYAGVLTRIASVTAPDRLRRLGIRLVCTGGEVLTPTMRMRIADAFGVPVRDLYGSFEFNLLAWQCPTGDAYHVCDDGLILEVLDQGRPVPEGARGTVVATSLHALTMPIIRYEQGDVVTQGSRTCDCGAPFATIGNVTGRMIDHFPLPDGRLVHPYAVFLPIRLRSPWIREFQVTQHREDHVVMRVVASPPPSDEQLAAVRELAAAGLGPAVRFELEVVPELALEPSGKFRMYRSLVRSDYA